MRAGVAAARGGKLGEAEPLAREALCAGGVHWGARAPPPALGALGVLGNILRDAGRRGDALEPTALKDPGLHCSHTLAAAPLNVPALHWLQVLTPSPLTVPGEHALHAAAPGEPA